LPNPIRSLEQLCARARDALVIDSLAEEIFASLSDDERFSSTVPPPEELISAVFPPADSKVTTLGTSEFNLNMEVFREELPRLMAQEPQGYVAICLGKVIGTDRNYQSLALRAWRKYPNHQVLVQPINPQKIALR
jgi:hypothetical protein